MGWTQFFAGAGPGCSVYSACQLNLGFVLCTACPPKDLILLCMQILPLRLLAREFSPSSTHPPLHHISSSQLEKMLNFPKLAWLEEATQMPLDVHSSSINKSTWSCSLTSWKVPDIQVRLSKEWDHVYPRNRLSHKTWIGLFSPSPSEPATPACQWSKYDVCQDLPILESGGGEYC